uniref:Coiled-coil SMC6 And NSE5 INteracting (CANIN) domain-containing protein n=1 Tax=Sus scrofa TaxID=9823 RepID=A0A8D0Q2V3_PIG
MRDAPCILPTTILSYPSLHPAWRSGWDGGGQGGTPQYSVPSTGLQTAAAGPILLPSLQGSYFDHPLHQGLVSPTRRLCSPTSALAPKSSKKPKIQASGDMFPSDWSPPPVEFLNLKALQADRAAPVQRQVDTVGPWSLRRLAHQLPEGLQQEPQDSDSTEHLASLEELFWNMAGTSPKAAAPEFTSGGSECYVNSLDYLLQEKREQALEQEREKLLLQDCPHLNSSDPDEDEVPLALEHRKLAERFSTSLQGIPAGHPGETVFVPMHHPLPHMLDHSRLKPRSHLEELFLSSPPAQQLSFLRSGLLSGLYLHVGDRPEALLRWLFQLLTWPPETSLGAFGLLWDLSVDGLIRQSDEDTYLWCPSLQEVTAAFHSLGARSPALHPLGPFQHSGSKANLSQCEQQDTPGETALDISLSHICKFLMLCALAQPGAYPDGSLLGLIELICQAGLDVGLRLLPKTDLQQLLLLLLENIQEWPGKLRPLCCALSQVSDHHHNLLALVQLFPDVTSRSRWVLLHLGLPTLRLIPVPVTGCSWWVGGCFHNPLLSPNKPSPPAPSQKPRRKD